ncbi:flavin reductase family protein [Alkalibacterium olivapovliticus]|uniref:Flavin reductase (DIM6/NTAB) family NADH-FMN oxidoreductase RutF n=1 Tax=Alkalibacterium olivapovliticus TaxID=99907 RepID=A0A2T0W5Z4_9LACT|nr:flavin reductase family protein [Alkalibacterium olivapovliticus]PRY82115.1 flavin reductase (DIM6/NTAB) family NADH-FMN oxidoreductase RutF [Alkalibacterium olivapovliticus]
MHHFKTSDLSAKQQYKFLTGSVIPRPIAWITSLNEPAGIINAAPFSFFSVASNQIPLLTVSILRSDGKAKDTAINIIDQEEAVVHIVSRDLTEAMNETSAPLASDESELDRTDLSLVDSSTVSVPGIKEALIRFETTLYQHIPIKDDAGKIVTDHFLLRVTDVHIDPSVYDPIKEYILPEELEPIARLSGNAYSEIGSIFSVIRPQN